MSQMTVNVGEPGVPVPDSGVLTISDYNADGAAVVGAVAVVLLILIAALVVMKRHYNIKIIGGRSRWLAKGLALLAIVMAAFSFSAMQARYGDDNVEAVDNDTDVLSISTEDIILNVEMTDKPVYAMTANKVTVETATTVGYNLSAYVEGGDLAKNDGDGKIMSLVGAEKKSLGDNTWGVASSLPNDQTSEVFFGLSADSSNPTLMKETNEATPAGDENTFYYGTYVTPELPYGVYTGATINYVAVANFDYYEPVEEDEVGVVYDGNGLKFADGEKKNRVVYGNDCRTMYKGDDYRIFKSNNIADDGTQNGPYSVTSRFESFRFDGADAVRIEFNYGITGTNGEIYISNGSEYVLYLSNNEGLASMGEAFNMSGEQLNVAYEFFDEPVAPYDYGFWAKIYPVYNDQRDGTSEISVCTPALTEGAYSTPEVETFDHWFINDSGRVLEFHTENDVKTYIERNKGRYGGEVITVYAHNPYILSFDGNGATAGTMEGLNSDWGDYTSGKIDLLAPNYMKIAEDGTSYGFVGWSKNPNATKDSGDKIYGPSEKADYNDFAFDGETREAKLYAIWAESEGTMQDFDGCDGMEIGQVTALTDLRDKNTYTVGKMQDGHCWMMENLRLESENSSDSSLAQGFGGSFVGLAEPEINTFGTSSFNSLYNYNNISGGNFSNRVPRYNNNNSRINDDSLTALPGGLTVDNQYKDGVEGVGYKWYGYGNLYSWAAAMANTDPLATSEDAASAMTSICPKNWHLPSSYYTGGEYSELDKALGGTGGPEFSHSTWSNYPNNFVFAGVWIDTRGALYRGIEGYYWGTTVTSERDYAVIAPISQRNNGGPSIGGYLSYFRYSGASVRCVADY